MIPETSIAGSRESRPPVVTAVHDPWQRLPCPPQDFYDALDSIDVASADDDPAKERLPTWTCQHRGDPRGPPHARRPELLSTDRTATNFAANQNPILQTRTPSPQPLRLALNRPEIVSDAVQSSASQP